jgi:S-adenosylmethionine:tRNA ribosyltransferase-isomerase
MIAATSPIQRPADARVLAVDSSGAIRHLARRNLIDLFRPGDLVIANDAATLPASLRGRHARTNAAIEVRLAGRESLAPSAVADMVAVVFGDGDFRLRTEDRPLPPTLRAGDRLDLGPLTAHVTQVQDHPRLVRVRFAGDPNWILAGIARHGQPIQYSHLRDPLALWDTWTPIAGTPAAFEPPSAGFALTWQLLERFAARDIRFATLTHAAGISSTGDPALDARLPFDEPYVIPDVTARLVEDARAHQQRVIAVGTSVVRALEHAGGIDRRLRSGHGLATGRIDTTTPLHIVDAILSGTHEPGTSHHALLCAFVTGATLTHIDDELNRLHYRTHEFGDSVFIERNLPPSPPV